MRLASQSPLIESGWIATDLGGAFYLVSMLARLNFFDHLERHFGVTSDLGGWTWIELLARGLLGRSVRNHLTDSVWRCFAALDGRDAGSQGLGTFRGADVYLLPAEWGPHPSHSAPSPRLTGLGLAIPRDLRRFLEFLLPFFRWRLAGALGLKDERALATTLLECPARVFTSATHVDIRFPLDAARPAVRLAGLDANPGWVPALGRVVSFEFV